MPFVVKINHAAISRMSSPGGDVWNWTKKIGRQTQTLAIATCPTRTGNLAHKHKLSLSKLPQGCYATIRVDSYYALYVHEGTHGPIVPSPPTKYLRLRAGGGYGPIRAKSVSGQRAQPWLREAMEHVLDQNHAR